MSAEPAGSGGRISDIRGPLQVARRQQLLEALHRDGALRISDLSTALGAAAVTIRRDIAQLAAEGLVRRVHGGVALIAAGESPSIPAQNTGLDEPAPSSVEPLAGRTVGMLVPSLEYYYP